MEVILQKDVETLGEAGDLVKVSSGYARNYLIPKNLAEVATVGALENRDRNIARIKAKAEKLYQEALGRAKQINEMGVLEIKAKAGDTGKLFGAVTTKQIASLLLEISGVEVDRKNISIDKAINKIGDYEIVIKLATKVSLTVPVKVIGEAAHPVVEDAHQPIENDTETEQE